MALCTYNWRCEACNCLYQYIRVCPGTYSGWTVTVTWTASNMYQYILVCTSMYWYVWHLARKANSIIHKVVGQFCQAPKVCFGIMVHTSMYQYVPVLVHICTYLYVLVKTASWLCLSHTWVVYLWKRQPWRKLFCARNKSSIQWRPVGIEKRIECNSIEACLWLMSIRVHTSTYQYVPICTWITWTLHSLKFDIILSYLLHRSCTLLYLTLRELPGW